jgi:alpha/beta superfamily hydrolase
MQDFSFLAPCPASGMIIHGDKDEVVPLAAVTKLAQKLSSQKNIKIDFRVVEGSDHFFQNCLDALISHVDDYLNKVLAKAA